METKELMNFDMCIWLIFDRYCQCFISGRKTGQQANSLISWAVQQLVRQFVNKVFIVDIKFRFTCGKSNMYWNFAMFQNIMNRIVAAIITKGYELLHNIPFWIFLFSLFEYYCCYCWHYSCCCCCLVEDSIQEDVD